MVADDAFWIISCMERELVCLECNGRCFLDGCLRADIVDVLERL